MGVAPSTVTEYDLIYGPTGPAGPRGPPGPTGPTGPVMWADLTDAHKDELLSVMHASQFFFGPTGAVGPTGPVAWETMTDEQKVELAGLMNVTNSPLTCKSLSECAFEYAVEFLDTGKKFCIRNGAFDNICVNVAESGEPTASFKAAKNTFVGDVSVLGETSANTLRTHSVQFVKVPDSSNTYVKQVIAYDDVGEVTSDKLYIGGSEAIVMTNDLHVGVGAGGGEEDPARHVRMGPGGSIKFTTSSLLETDGGHLRVQGGHLSSDAFVVGGGAGGVTGGSAGYKLAMCDHDPDALCVTDLATNKWKSLAFDQTDWV